MMKDKASLDVGRMGVIASQHMKCKVTVVWRDKMMGETKENLKHPNSLVQLEEGLMMERDVDGMLWVV
jgi:hypothetical protein